jgi:hypothetical protein
LASLESVTQQGLADRPQPTSSSHGLWFPTALAGFGDPLSAGVTCLLRSVHRVWSPSRRFTPFESGPVLFHTGSAPGIHPSELSPLERYPAVSGRKNPPTVSSLCIPCTLRYGAGWRDRSFWALTLSRVPDEPHVFSTRSAGCSPGFLPPEVFGRTLVRISPVLRSHAFDNTLRCRRGVSAFRSVPPSARPSHAVNHLGKERQPLQAFCTTGFLSIQTTTIRAIEFTSPTRSTSR